VGAGRRGRGAGGGRVHSAHGGGDGGAETGETRSRSRQPTIVRRAA
jgi:hypothetical protein